MMYFLKLETLNIFLHFVDLSLHLNTIIFFSCFGGGEFTFLFEVIHALYAQLKIHIDSLVPSRITSVAGLPGHHPCRHNHRCTT